MYTSSEDARSDLFLAGAVFVFGPMIITVLLRIIPLGAIPGVRPVLLVVVPLLTTLLVPALLIRYRDEPLAMYGVRGGGASSAALGLVVAVPVVVASLLAALLETALPSVPAALLESPLFLASRLARWIGLAGLAVYATVKARDAFGGDPQYVRTGMEQIGRVLGLIVGVATLLLLIPPLFDGGFLGAVPRLLLIPLGVAAAVVLAHRRLRGATITKRSTLLAPTVLLALDAFTFRLDAVELLTRLRVAGLLAALGLVIAAIVETRRSAAGALTLGLLLALLTQL